MSQLLELHFVLKWYKLVAQTLNYGLFKKGKAVRVSTEFTSASISINLCGTKSLAALNAANESLSGTESSKNLELK